MVHSKYLWMMFVESGTFFLGQEGSVRNIIRDKLYLSQYVSYIKLYQTFSTLGDQATGWVKNAY